jgi:hypothetical protein
MFCTQEGKASGDDQIRDIFVYPEGNSVPAGIANNLAGIYLQKGEWLKGTTPYTPYRPPLDPL